MESSKLDETLLSKYIAPENKLQTPYPLIEDLSDSNEKLAMFERLDSGFLKAVRESGILDFCEKYLRKVRGIFSDLDVGELMQYGEQPVNDLFLTYLVSSHKTIFANMLEYIYLKEDKVASLATSGPRYIAMLLSMVH
jgi:hypothetical protein